MVMRDICGPEVASKIGKILGTKGPGLGSASNLDEVKTVANR